MKNKKQGVSQIGRYEIRKELGRGTMGIVYEAHDPALGRTIALKTIQPGGAFSSDGDRREYEKRFHAEAQIAARLSHPGVVVVHDVGRDPEGTLYIALEYLHGRTLEEQVSSEGALPWREALRIVGRIASALHYAHAEGVVHRDIKPANVMLLRSGEPKIMDFGIAKHEAGHLTAAGRLFGTPLYMAPEQARGDPADARSDLFSLGSVAYTLLTGQPPFDAPNLAGILARVEAKEARPPSERVRDLPPDVDYVIARAMAKSPGDRYPDGATLAEDIEDVLAGRPPRHRAEWTPPARGDATLMSASIPSTTHERDAELPLLPDVTTRTTRRRRMPAPRLVVLLGFTVAGWFLLHPEDVAFWRDVLWRVRRSPLVQQAIARFRSLEPAPATETKATPGEHPPESTTPAAVRAEDGPGGRAAGPPSGAPPAAEGSEPERRANASEDFTAPLPSPAIPVAASATEAAPAPGRLIVDFEHHLKRGTLRVWIDDRLALNEDFDSRRTRKILAFELREGLVQEVLSLPPGEHEVRVQVRWDDNLRTARITGGFRGGESRRLDVTVARFSGRLSLEWK